MAWFATVPPMAESARPSRPLSNAALLSLGLGAAGGVAALGGALPWAHLPGLAGGCLALLLLGFDRTRRTPRLPWAAALFALSGAFCLLQLVPLPTPALALLAPEKAALVEAVLTPLGLGGPSPVTLDPAATWREVAKGCALMAAAWAAALLCRSRTSRQRLLEGLGLLAAAVALNGLVHAVLGQPALFGLYSFSQSLPVVTPFGNPNHLAGFMALGGALLLGRALEVRLRTGQAAWLSAWALTAWAAWASQSRAGLAAYALAQAGAVAWTRGPRAAVAVFAAGGAAGAAAVGWLLASGTGPSKLSLWPDFLRAGLAFARSGMGRGTFELGYLRHQPAPFFTTHTHPENQLLQWLAELGALPAALLVTGTCWMFWRLARRELTVLERAALCGLAALGLHNLLDFSLELPAVSFCGALVLGALSRPDEQGHAPGLRAGRPAAAALVLAGLGAFAAARARDDVASAERQVRALLQARAAPATFDEAVRPLIALHPADAVLPASAAWLHAASPQGDPGRALAWANRALYQDPWNAAAHQAAARALLRAGRDAQAFLEYRLALEALHGRADGPVLEELLAVARKPGDWMAACPRTAEGLDSLSHALAIRDRRAEAEGLLEALLPGLPQSAALAPLYDRWAWLRGQRRDFDGAAAVLAQAEEVAPGTPALTVQRAHLLSASGKGAEAVALLEEAVRTRPGEPEFHLLLAETLLSTAPRRAEEAAGRAQPFVTDSAGKVRLQRVRLAAARALSSTVRVSESLRALSLLEPTSAATRYEAADLLLEQGQPQAARRWLEEGAALDTAEGAAAARAARAPRLQALEQAAPVP